MSENKGFEWNPLSINEYLPLHKLSAFWLSIAIFVGPAIILAYPYFCLCWPEPSSYDELLKHLGFPTFIASLSLPLTVAIGRFHGSKQRASANMLTRNNNAFNHFYNHRQHFVDYLEGKEKVLFNDIIKLDDAYLLYAFMFSENDESHVSFHLDLDKVTRELSVFYTGQLNAKRLNVYSTYNDTFQINEIIESVVAPIGLKLDLEKWGILINERITNDKFEKILVDSVVALLSAIVSFSSSSSNLDKDPFLERSQIKKEIKEVVRKSGFHKEYEKKHIELVEKHAKFSEE